MCGTLKRNQRWRTISAVSLCFMYVFLIGRTCCGNEDADRYVREAEDGSTDYGDKKKAEPHESEDWNEELIDDTVIAIELTKELQELPEETINMLYAEVFNSEHDGATSENNPRRSKRGLRSWWSDEIARAKKAVLKQVLNFVHRQQNNPSCYEEVGCFYRMERMSVEVGGPASPDTVGTKIMIYDSATSKGKEVSHSTWTAHYQEHKVDLEKPLFVITHGFTKDSDMSWMDNLKGALFENGDCNVMLVTWINGAKFPNYPAAAANSAMPGVLVSKLLQTMMDPKQGDLSPAKVHFIGFSLGAQAAGFCGRHFYSATKHLLGRITGLDPAGPLFEGTNVSLSSTDAKFVDILHTHSGKLEDYKLGISEAIGHVDFYPNGGSSQPGCEGALMISPSQRIFSATAICFIYVFLIVISCSGSENVNYDVSDAAQGLTANLDENNADTKEPDDWTEDLVNDIFLETELIKALQHLSEDIINMLCKDVFHSSSEVTSTEKERRRTKRGIKDLWNKFNENVKEQFFKQALNFVQQKQHNPECYEDVGCFYRAQRMAVDVGGPAPPKQVGTKITFFDGLSKTGSEVTHRSWANVLKLRKVDLDKPLFVITHGFTSDNDMSWMHTMKEALFNHLQDKCNVILVEWIQGAKFPRYAAAAANSPMPGTLISLLLIEMNKPDLGHLSPESAHLIGFSLGAHVLGFCGRHFYRATGKKLGRITGLDPAGPLFEGTNVSLSFHDAEFVDVIHTHSGSLQERKLGIKDSIGNVDFFPNGGKSQPGCESMLKIGCSHKRARAYFIESLTSTTCHFKSVQCDNGWENYDKCELTEDVSFIGEMGYNSKTKNGRGNQYLRTSSQTPFCIPQKG